MSDNVSEVWLAVANLVAQRGGTEDAARVIRAVALSDRRREDAAHQHLKVNVLQRDLDAYRDRQRKEAIDRDAERAKRRAALGDGCIVLACGGRLLIEGGEPTRIHDGDPHAQFREERREKALAEASAIWGEKLLVLEGWGKDGEAKLDVDDVPF